MKSLVIFAIVLITSVLGEELDLKTCNGNRYLFGSSKNGCTLENKINDQIKREMDAFHTYLQMGYFFAHEDYNLPHLSNYFLESAKEELKHAQSMMEYQVLRGAHVQFSKFSFETPTVSFKSALQALKKALEIETDITKEIIKIWKKASEYNDVHMSDFLETNFVTEQYEALKKYKSLIKTLERMTKDSKDQALQKLAEFQFDKLVMKDFK
ncbi:ferritin, heavy subunit-like isoform X2 [Rhopilema esculentum]|uniref:ferritin, heavy subunit-like isoform X2 n=1 Tax=Rhopilema esculentum TaxID=499914 RepID=UPI0031DD2695